MTQDHDSEFRMILSHAFLGSDTSGIDRETWDLAISGCVKYLESQLKPVPLPDDIQKWIEDFAHGKRPINHDYRNHGDLYDTNEKDRNLLIEGATAMYDLLSAQIEEQRKNLNSEH